MPSKPACREAAVFEEFARAARTEVVAAQFLFELFVTMNVAFAAFDVCFRGEALAALAHVLKSRAVRRSRCVT